MFAGALGVEEFVEGLQRHLGIAIDLAAGQRREKRSAPQRFRPVCEVLLSCLGGGKHGDPPTLAGLPGIKSMLA